MVPQACKDGNMGNRNLYHFCLAILIFLDISVPLTLFAIILLTLNTKERSFLNKTLGGGATDANTSLSDTAQSTPCCTTAVSAGALVFGLVMFLIFVTIAGQLGQASSAFCNGYVSFV